MTNNNGGLQKKELFMKKVSNLNIIIEGTKWTMAEAVVNVKVKIVFSLMLSVI